MDRDQLAYFTKALGIHLTPRELDYLECLMYYPDRWKSRDYFMSFVYAHKPGDAPSDKLVDIYIMKLRRKLSELATIETYRGIGYRMSWNYDHIQVLKNSFSPHQLT